MSNEFGRRDGGLKLAYVAYMNHACRYMQEDPEDYNALRPYRNNIVTGNCGPECSVLLLGV